MKISRKPYSGCGLGRASLLAMMLSLLAFASGTAGASENASERGENRARLEPQGFLYGAAVGIDSGIYDDYDQQVTALPILGYRGKRLSVFGPFVSWKAAKLGEFELDLRLSPRFDGFDESDSDIFEGMEEREISLDAGIGLGYQRNDWKIELSSLHDVLDRSDGRELSLGLARVYRAGPLLVEPGIGLSYLDSRHVDYYYGVTDTEATSFRPAYDGDSALNTTLGITLATPAFLGGLTRVVIENTWFDSAISDSPLTDEDSSLSLLVTFSKFFGT
ncbi:MAG: MipA/OmpV family protein [Gammaproteobacteria bacterium]|nr:MipA/OmpV family protein [Gammaproteobacteria bacterium]